MSGSVEQNFMRDDAEAMAAFRRRAKPRKSKSPPREAARYSKRLAKQRREWRRAASSPTR